MTSLKNLEKSFQNLIRKNSEVVHYIKYEL
jgi:hypothetical protein